MKADTGFSLGFFCGMILGAIGVYVVVTPEGKKLKATIIEEYNKHHQALTLETVLPVKESASESSMATSLHTLIGKVRSYLNKSNVEPKLKEHSKVTILKKKHVFKKK